MDSMRDTITSLSPRSQRIRWRKWSPEQNHIKGKESNAEKKVHNTKECVPNTGGSHYQRKNNYTLPITNKIAFRKIGKVT